MPLREPTKRPAFRRGTVSLSHRAEDLPKTPIVRNIDRMMKRPGDYLRPEPNPRMPTGTDRFEELQEEQLKKKADDALLDKIMNVEIEDPANRQNKIMKRISIGELMKTLEGSLAGITTILRQTDSQIQDNQNEIIILIQNAINELVMGGNIERVKELTPLFVAGLNKFDLSSDPRDYDLDFRDDLIPLSTLIHDRQLQSKVILYMSSSGVDSTNELEIQSKAEFIRIVIRRIINQNERGFFDLRTGMHFNSRADALNERTIIKRPDTPKSDISDLSGDPRDEIFEIDFDEDDDNIPDIMDDEVFDKKKDF